MMRRTLSRRCRNLLRRRTWYKIMWTVIKQDNKAKTQKANQNTCYFIVPTRNSVLVSYYFLNHKCFPKDTNYYNNDAAADKQLGLLMNKILCVSPWLDVKYKRHSSWLSCEQYKLTMLKNRYCSAGFCP